MMGVSLLLAAGGNTLPPYASVAPFILILLGIAILPLVAHHWWERGMSFYLFDGSYPIADIWQYTARLFVLWLICLWMYRRKIFIRV